MNAPIKIYMTLMPELCIPCLVLRNCHDWSNLKLPCMRVQITQPSAKSNPTHCAWFLCLSKLFLKAEAEAIFVSKQYRVISRPRGGKRKTAQIRAEIINFFKIKGTKTFSKTMTNSREYTFSGLLRNPQEQKQKK